jgi:SAM-dependent methyltransferase
MNESSKTRRIRSKEYYNMYMGGSVLDIGCADDLCVPHAIPFDKEEGDANKILDYLKSETFDCVHSSHCIEHVIDPKQCLGDWWALVKPNGFLITIAPEENLYEQGNWPSLFNPDHKNTFRISGASSWSPRSNNLLELTAALPGARIISADVEDDGYVHHGGLLRSKASALTRKVFSKAYGLILHTGLNDTFVNTIFLHIVLALGCPIDQTRGRALAQKNAI